MKSPIYAFLLFCGLTCAQVNAQDQETIPNPYPKQGTYEYVVENYFNKRRGRPHSNVLKFVVSVEDTDTTVNVYSLITDRHGGFVNDQFPTRTYVMNKDGVTMQVEGESEPKKVVSDLSVQGANVRKIARYVLSK